MKLFELLRYAKPSPGPHVELIDGVHNLFHATRWPDWPGLAGAGRVQLDHGIDSVRRVDAVDGRRRPAILIASKPHMAGSDWTPWHDELDPRNGHVRYFGDNKATLVEDPAESAGNRSVLAEFSLHQSSSVLDRMRAAPLLFFEGIPHEGKDKGFWQFLGFGLLERATLVTQVDPKGRPFVNFVFDCTLLDLSAEHLALPWAWIAARRDPHKTLAEALQFAPESWHEWVKSGSAVRERIRQRILGQRLMLPAEQRPEPNTPAWSALQAVMGHYKTSGPYQGSAVGEHRFEALASEVVGAQLREGGTYRPGWITKRAGDGGIDFVSRLDVGVATRPLRLVVLGQAKCIPSTGSTGGHDLARTVARLERGWIGAFVTTGYFTEQAQREALTDRFPLLLLNGKHVGDLVARAAIERGMSPRSYIAQVDDEYEDRVSQRQPSEILDD